MIPILFAIVLFGGCGIALWKGHTDERLTAVVLLVAASVSPLVETGGFTSPEIGILVVDALLFAYLLYQAMVSDRFWPMWAAGFQIIATLVHVARFTDPTIWPMAYATAGAFWAYPVLFALGIGTLLEAQYRQR